MIGGSLEDGVCGAGLDCWSTLRNIETRVSYYVMDAILVVPLYMDPAQ